MTTHSRFHHKFLSTRTNLLLNRCISLVLTGFLIMVSGQVLAQVVINEVDYDQPSTDTAEFIEIRNNGAGSVDLSTYSLEIINGSGGGASISTTITLPAVSLAAGDYFVVCGNAVNTVNCDLDVSPDSNLIQNGAPDAVGLRDGDTLVDAISYEGDTGAPYTEGSGAGLVDTGDGSLSRIPDGADTDQNNVDFNFCAITPGAANSCIIPEEAPTVESTTPSDNAMDVALDSDIVINFSEAVTATGSWFSINCASSGSHTAVETGGPQSYTLNPGVDFDMSELCTVDVIAAQISDTDADDPPDEMAADYQFNFTATGPVGPPVDSPMLINEVDADTTGTDVAEFVELFDGGSGSTPLDGLSVVLHNGSDDASYQAYDLDGYSTDADGYFVLCGNAGNVPNCDLDVSPDSNLVQNGADAVALVLGDAVNFPNDTPVSTTNLVDAIVYDTNDNDDAGILVLLNASQPQINEGGEGNQAGHSNQRCPNGAGGGRNTDSYAQAEPTPGAANDCVVPLINEVDVDMTSTDAAEFIELITPDNGNFPLDGYSLVFYNGSDDASYLAFDLDTYSTNSDGYFVLCGNAANVANCDLDVTPDTNLLQNGADAVALVLGDAVDFPNDTPVSTVNLIDALVYDTDDGDDAGLLVLLNAGQPQINEDDGDNKDDHSNQRCPNGSGGVRNTDTYSQAVPTPGDINVCSAVEIFEIQGAGSTSMYDGFDILTANNIVTAVGPEGFFIQTPDDRADISADTSNGIYVFTGGAPTVVVGDDVNVIGRVDEFFDFTEFTNSPMVTINSSGNPLPAVIALGVSVPSSNPAAPSCAIEFECYEGMLVEIANGTVTGGNQDFSSDLVAEAYITAVGSRSYREPGVIYPGLGGSIPTWDGNPEVFELDPDRLGLPNVIIPGGSSFSATGVIGYDYGDYELWPTSLAVAPAVLPGAVRARMASETTVGSFNLYRFATDGTYTTRLTKLSQYIRNVLGSPDILAVQEVASLGALQDLADEIAMDDGSVHYATYLIEGNDIGGIDVGFMVRSDITVDSVSQLGADEIFSYDDSLLHDRPPLLLEGSYTANGRAFQLAVIVVHNRSLNGIETERVQLKRLAQAESIAAKVQAFQDNNPTTPLIVVGDFNAFEFTDGYADAVGHIKGDFNPAESLESGSDLVDPNLTNQVDMISAFERYSFVYEGNAQALDHALTSQAADTWVRGLEFGRGNADAGHDQINDPSTPVRSSDHDGLVLFLMTDFDGDGVGDDQDACPFDENLIDPDPRFGCNIPIPTLGPVGLLLMLLLLGGLGVFTLRRPIGFRRQ